MSGELRRRQRADTREGDLAQPEHAALAGDQRVAEEDHRQRDARDHQRLPVRRKDQRQDADPDEQDDREREIELRVEVLGIGRRGEATPTVRGDGAVERTTHTFLLVDAARADDVDDERDDDERERDRRHDVGRDLAIGW
jgi:hypothetical protein